MIIVLLVKTVLNNKISPQKEALIQKEDVIVFNSNMLLRYPLRHLQ